jgi:hypothetical protein
MRTSIGFFVEKFKPEPKLPRCYNSATDPLSAFAWFRSRIALVRNWDDQKSPEILRVPGEKYYSIFQLSKGQIANSDAARWLSINGNC